MEESSDPDQCKIDDIIEAQANLAKFSEGIELNILDCDYVSLLQTILFLFGSNSVSVFIAVVGVVDCSSVGVDCCCGGTKKLILLGLVTATLFFFLRVLTQNYLLFVHAVLLPFLQRQTLCVLLCRHQEEEVRVHE